MYDHVLVPIEGTLLSKGIIPYAKGIASAIGASVTFLRVVKDPTSADDGVQADMERLAATHGAECRVVPLRDDVPTSIIYEAHLKPKTLIAMSTPGRANAVVSVLGSTARTVVRSSHHPVLLFRPTDRSASDDPITINEVILPLDGSTLSESMQIEAVAWARALGVSLTLIQVLPEATRSTPGLKSSDIFDNNYVFRLANNLSREFGVTVGYEVYYGDPAERILDYISGRPDVLTVMATRGHTPIHSAIIGSVTSTLIRNSGVPMVVQSPGKII